MSQPNTVMIIIAPAHDHTKHRWPLSSHDQIPWLFQTF